MPRGQGSKDLGKSRDITALSPSEDDGDPSRFILRQGPVLASVAPLGASYRNGDDITPWCGPSCASPAHGALATAWACPVVSHALAKPRGPTRSRGPGTRAALSPAASWATWRRHSLRAPSASRPMAAMPPRPSSVISPGMSMWGAVLSRGHTLSTAAPACQRPARSSAQKRAHDRLAPNRGDVHVCPGSLESLGPQVAGHRLPRRKLPRQGAPGDAAAVPRAKAVQDLAHGGRTAAPTRLGCMQGREG